MRSLLTSFLLLPSLLLGVSLGGCCNYSDAIDAGEWSVSVAADGLVTLAKGDGPVFRSMGCSFIADGRQIDLSDYSGHKMRKESIADDFGEGALVVVEYSGEGLPMLRRSIYLYDERDYILTSIEIIGTEGNEISTGRLSVVELPGVFVGAEDSGRTLFIPFDNDKWIRYSSRPLSSGPTTAYEVGVSFENTSRHGIVVGSIDHTMWKTAVTTTPTGGGNISIQCFSGVADTLTRDSKPHGIVKGTSVSSPKIFVGAFDDWRDGLEAYADANAVVAPPRQWTGAVPFGWNSWGVLKFRLNPAKALEVSDYIADNLQSRSFVNPDGTVVVGLDSGWSDWPESDLKAFADLCRANGQQAGIYLTPFTDWGKRGHRTIRHAEQYTAADAWLLANGKPQELDGAYAVDPTHPAVEMQMKYYSEMFRRLGFSYVKMDFMTHGAMEADRWYLPEIQTGMQAYNYGMALLEKYFGDMYVNLSISPVFPANYANSRRIACDAWNTIKDTEYTLNALSYGWWQDRVYNYNDADHIVLVDATEGENRARVTSGVITGIYICGDDFSLAGSREGKERAEKFLCNPAVNAVATGEAFRPVEGNGVRSENRFVSRRGDKTYFALFNYEDHPQTFTVDPARLDLDADAAYTLNELWSGAAQNARGIVEIEVPAKDAKLFEITTTETITE